MGGVRFESHSYISGQYKSGISWGDWKNGPAIIVGNFNLHTEWTSEIGRRSLKAEFKEFIQESFSEQHVPKSDREKLL